MQNIAENIKNYRELKKMTREQVADALQLSLSGYAKLERGEVDISVSKLFKIAEVLQVSVPQILNFDATQIFNLSHNQVVNGVSVTEQHNTTDTYKDKYIALLEKEVERLRNVNGQKS